MCNPAATEPAIQMDYGVGMSQDDFMKKDECADRHDHSQLTTAASLAASWSVAHDSLPAHTGAS